MLFLLFHSVLVRCESESEKKESLIFIQCLCTVLVLVHWTGTEKKNLETESTIKHQFFLLDNGHYLQLFIIISLFLS